MNVEYLDKIHRQYGIKLYKMNRQFMKMQSMLSEVGVLNLSTTRFKDVARYVADNHLDENLYYDFCDDKMDEILGEMEAHYLSQDFSSGRQVSSFLLTPHQRVYTHLNLSNIYDILTFNHVSHLYDGRTTILTYLDGGDFIDFKDYVTQHFQYETQVDSKIRENLIYLNQQLNLIERSVLDVYDVYTFIKQIDEQQMTSFYSWLDRSEY